MTWTTGALRERLPNGLTLVAQRDPAAPAVAVITHVNAGFFDEPDEWQGISHVLEHMFFKGTARRGVGRIAQETKALGGYLNASTSYDRTLYYAVLPARNLRAALDIQSDALREPTLDLDELARELRVIIEEAKRKLDSPSAVAGETLHELLYDQHRIRRWRIGHEAQLADFTATDLRGYYTSRYVPSRTTVVLVGDLEVEEMLAAARPFYADWSAPAAVIAAGPTERTAATMRTRTLRGDVAQAELVLGWRGVPALHADETPLDLASAILGTGRGSWLHRALREPGIAASTGAYSYATDEVGVFGVAASGAADRLDEMVSGLAAQVTRLREQGPTEEELDRARTLLRVRWVRRMESYEARATALAWASAHGELALLDREYARLLTVTPVEIRDAARRHLPAKGVSGIVYLPATATVELTTEQLTAAFAGPAGVTPLVAAVAAPRSVPRAAGAGTGRSRTVAGTYHLDLPGGDVLVRRKEGIPTTTLSLHFRREWEGADDAGLGALTSRSAARGAGGFDAASLALAFERLGGSLGPSVSSDVLSLGATVLTERLEEAAALMQLVVREARFQEGDVAAERGVLIEEARDAADDMFRFPFQVAFRGAFGDSGYGVPVGGFESTLTTFTSAQTAERWRAMTGGRVAVIAVGDEAPERLADRIAATLPHLLEATRPAENGSRRPAPWMASGTSVVHTRQKQQSAFAMLFPGPARSAPEYRAAEVWAAVASGLGGRLFEALRDKRSLAYTVLGTAWGRKRAGALGAYIATSPAREAEARAEMLKELTRFAETVPGVEELERAKSYLAGQAEISRMTAGAVASEMADAWLAGEGLEELEAPWERYRHVTGEEVRAVAEAAFDPAQMAEGVVRGTT
jgi:zinc protease